MRPDLEGVDLSDKGVDNTLVSPVARTTATHGSLTWSLRSNPSGLYEIVQRLRRYDGTYRWFQNNGFPLRDAQGNIVRWSPRLRPSSPGCVRYSGRKSLTLESLDLNEAILEVHLRCR